MADALYELRNYYYIGAYQQCAKEAQKTNVKTDRERLEKDVFLFRAYIALGKSSVVLSEISADVKEDVMKAVRLLGLYKSQTSKERVVVQVEELANNTVDDLALVILGSILLSDNKHEEAYKVLKRADLLEARALTIQTLLAINRFDLALKNLKQMQEVDEDATLTQLALAWLYISNGKEKLQDAFYIYQEMIDKFGATADLLVSQSAVKILKNEIPEAENLLQLAEEKDSGSAAVLINQFLVSSVLHKNDDVLSRILTQLKAEHSDLAWVKSYLEKEQLFDELD
ncbi:unnamed protein product [Bursaphelenchus xylophilus]|uniref:Coatomer subunit epsilon n=1 Tax=Bursaphelenchus xylophilus TaxID=6326 RepID=A0A1I7SD89_BURXY|nr:unnamed protein product [Bursaphelenchus xylophilus]CAG9130542.1 unnamed protein product [Bursaphelenchus xylophilus]